MTMTPALAAHINALAAPIGPVPSGPGHQADGGGWVAAPVQTPAHLLERVLLGHVLSENETAWFHRFVIMALLRGQPAVECA